jgi:hypothetical protein
VDLVVVELLGGGTVLAEMAARPDVHKSGWPHEACSRQRWSRGEVMDGPPTQHNATVEQTWGTAAAQANA